jgi:PilZ domain.
MASPNMPTILMNVAWTLYNLVMLGVVLAVNWETLQLRRNVRLSVDFPAWLHLSDGRVIETRTRDISEGGVGLQWSVTTNAPAIEVAAVELRVGAQSSLFPAARTLVAQGLLAVEFAPMNAATEGELVRIIYGRADAWLDWRDHEKPVGVWRSLVQIIRLGAIGLWRLGRGWRRADQQAV